MAEDSFFQTAISTPVAELTDEQKALITGSWESLNEDQKVTYAEFAPVAGSSSDEAAAE